MAVAGVWRRPEPFAAEAGVPEEEDSLRGTLVGVFRIGDTGGVCMAPASLCWRSSMAVLLLLRRMRGSPPPLGVRASVAGEGPPAAGVSKPP